MKYLIIIVTIASFCLWGFGQNILDNSDPEKASDKRNLTDEELVKSYETICWELSLIDNNDVITPQKTTTKISRNYDGLFDCQTAEISGDITMGFDSERGMVLTIFNDKLYKKLYESKNKLDDPYNEGRSRKTVEQVLQESSTALKILCSGQKINYVLEDIVFRSKYDKRGTWYLRYRRYYNGYKFNNDTIRMELSDTGGLLTFSNHCTSEILSAEVKVDRGKALKLSKDFALRMMNSKELLSYSKAHKLGDAFWAELLIVNPNYICTSKSTYEGDKIIRKARLAWVTKFGVLSNSRSVSRLPDCEIQVWVDGENGEILGGDFK